MNYNKYNGKLKNEYSCCRGIIIWQASEKIVFLQRVSLIRSAPAELPQDRKVARVGGCSGAI